MEKGRIPGLQNEDIYKRINFLYQAAYKCLKTNPSDLSLCRYYVYTLNAITRRLTLHLHPFMKRSMCNRCCMLLIPGVTAIVRHRSKRQSHAVVTCLECGTFKRYLTIPDKVPWLEREENWNDVVVNGVACKSSQTKLTKKERKEKRKQQQGAKESEQTKCETNKEDSVQQQTVRLEDDPEEMDLDSGHPDMSQKIIVQDIKQKSVAEAMEHDSCIGQMGKCS